MRRWINLLIGMTSLLGLALSVQAQTCTVEKANLKGTVGADVAVSSSAVTVADANSRRCALYIHNSGADQMVCGDATGNGADPTATTYGILFEAGAEKTIEDSAKGEWKCIRVTGDTTAQVSESLP